MEKVKHIWLAIVGPGHLARLHACDICARSSFRIALEVPFEKTRHRHFGKKKLSKEFNEQDQNNAHSTLQNKNTTLQPQQKLCEEHYSRLQFTSRHHLGESTLATKSSVKGAASRAGRTVTLPVFGQPKAKKTTLLIRHRCLRSADRHNHEKVVSSLRWQTAS